MILNLIERNEIMSTSIIPNRGQQKKLQKHLTLKKSLKNITQRDELYVIHRIAIWLTSNASNHA